MHYIIFKYYIKKQNKILYKHSYTIYIYTTFIYLFIYLLFVCFFLRRDPDLLYLGNKEAKDISVQTRQLKGVKNTRYYASFTNVNDSGLTMGVQSPKVAAALGVTFETRPHKACMGYFDSHGPHIHLGLLPEH